MIAANVSGRRPMCAAARFVTAKPPVPRALHAARVGSLRKAVACRHDNFNFPIQVNHPGGPQSDDIR
jgi:hypothetical protein